MNPSNAVQAPGVGSVSADQFNTYVQTCLNYAQLRTFTGVSNMSVYVLGAVSQRDGGQGMYYYDAASVATDNNGSVIVPNGAVQGAWLSDPAVLPPSAVNVRYITSGAADTALVSDTVIVWASGTGSPKTETLPAPGPATKGRTFIVKDGAGNAATYPITVVTAGGFTGGHVINSPFMALTFVDDGASQYIVTADYAPNTNPAFDVLAYGAVGDGDADDTNAILGAVTAACANGGQVRFPAGKFIITSTIGGDIAAGANLTIIGAGQEATQIICVATNGFAFTYGSPFSSFNARDFTLATDQTGGQTGLLLVLDSGVTAHGSNEYAPFNTIENVSFRGDDLAAGHAHCWGNAFISTGVSNLNIIGGGVNGPAAPTMSGTGYNISGNSSVPFYAVVINFTGVGMNTLETGVFYDDWVQGMTFDAVNMTGCDHGVQTVASPAGIIDQLAIVNSQFFCSTVCVGVFAPGFVGLQVSNSLFSYPANGVGIRVMGTNWIVSGNVIAGASTTGTVGLHVAGASASGGVASNNLFLNNANGIHVPATVASPVMLSMNQFTANTLDYAIDNGATGVIITDVTPRVFTRLPPCNAGTQYSRLTIADSPTVTFNAALTVGGSDGIGYALCNGAGYVFR